MIESGQGKGRSTVNPQLRRQHSPGGAGAWRRGVPLPIRCSMACVGQDGGEGVEIRRADEQDHGDVLIHSWYPLSVFWTFVKHFRQ
jgi:hypothetical protein